jgi:hypothetical protein
MILCHPKRKLVRGLQAMPKQVPETSLAQTYRKLLSHISLHSPVDVKPRLIAVSKGQSAARIRELFHLGQRQFGENYVQELLTKAADLADLPIEWVFIGHLQSNKIRKLATICTEVQTLAQWSHAEQLARCIRELKKAPFPVFLEVKLDESETKIGLAWDDILAFCERVQTELPELSVQGIMAIPPDSYQDANSDEVPKLYADLRTLASEAGAGQLSLGMSGDLDIALAAGSNVVRIGQALMGPRSNS